jgi:predicted nucleic acid-binding Zn ribbon protein
LICIRDSLKKSVDCESLLPVRPWHSKCSSLGRTQKKEALMFLILAIVLLMVWGVGSLAFHAVGAMIHLLLILALVSVIVHFVRDGRSGARI